MLGGIFMDFGDLFGGGYYYGYNPLAEFLPIVMLASLILRLAGGIILVLLFLPKKKRVKLEDKRFLLFLYDFLNFRFMSITAIAKVTYVMVAFYLFITGIYSAIAFDVLAGLLTAFLGNVVLRIIYELCLILFSIHENLNTLTNHVTGREETNLTNEHIAKAFRVKKPPVQNYNYPQGYPQQAAPHQYAAAVPPPPPPPPAAVQAHPVAAPPPPAPAAPPPPTAPPPPPPPPPPPSDMTIAPQMAPPAAPAQQLATCPSCGNQVDAGINFCNRCGTQIQR